MKKDYHIMIADHSSISRIGLRVLCQESLPYPVIYEAASISELYQNLRSHKMDLLILDLFLGNRSTLSAMHEIQQFNPNLNILVVTSASEDIYGNRVLSEGVKGFISSSEKDERIKQAITRVADGNYYISQELYLNSLDKLNEKAKSSNPFERLTNKEMEIVNYLLKGLSTSDISYSSQLAASTVSTYKMRIFQKLEIKNLMELSEVASLYQLV